tara:strand:+ start:863 stop:1345 length:483 start_codon:yes stop_codon:yes gene_type:complete
MALFCLVGYTALFSILISFHHSLSFSLSFGAHFRNKNMVKINKNAKPASQLPSGWMVLTKYRKKGASKGKLDRTYYSPEMESFRSLKAVKRFIAANAANAAPEADEEEEIEDNLIVEQQNDVVNIAIVSAASSSQALADSSNSNDVIVIDSSSDDESLWM